MATRKGWKDLSPAYKKRLQRQGVTAASYRQGVDIRAARGHPNEGAPVAGVRRNPQRRALVDKAVRGQATEPELRRLRAERPTWLPTRKTDGSRLRVRPEVAAALNQLPSPDRWRRIELDPAPDGQPWTVRVWTKRAKYPITITIPGGGAEGTGAKEALDVFATVHADLEDTYSQQGRARQVFNEPTVEGTT